MYLPWSAISSYHCLACGTCCYHFAVPLRFNEAIKIARSFGWSNIENRKGRLFIRKINGRCPFLIHSGSLGLCYLQSIGIKPKACKLWPFHISERPEHGRSDEAIFTTKQGTFYVYLDARCPGVKLGRPDEALVSTLIEALEIWLGIRDEQILTTSRFPQGRILSLRL